MKSVRTVLATILVSGVFILTGCTLPPQLQVPTDDAETETPSETSTPTFTQETSESEQIASSAQEVYFSISGGCLESFEAIGSYSIFEEYQDDCQLIVELYPATPERLVLLQFYEEGWITETSSVTDVSGSAYLNVDPYCDDGLWCDGTWDYRVLVEGDGVLPEESSEIFELEFISF